MRRSDGNSPRPRGGDAANPESVLSSSNKDWELPDPLVEAGASRQVKRKIEKVLGSLPCCELLQVLHSQPQITRQYFSYSSFKCVLVPGYNILVGVDLYYLLFFINSRPLFHLNSSALFSLLDPDPTHKFAQSSIGSDTNFFFDVLTSSHVRSVDHTSGSMSSSSTASRAAHGQSSFFLLLLPSTSSFLTSGVRSTSG
jgi:hypothetical protein